MRSPIVCVLAMAVVSVATASFGGSIQLGSMLDAGGPGYNRDACLGTATMVPTAGFTNGISKGRFKFKSNCVGIVVLTNLTTLTVSDGIAGTGDEAICLMNFQSNAPAPSACGSFALRGEILGTATAQKIKIKLYGPTQLPGTCPFASGSQARITSVECFVPSPAYSAAAACPGTFTSMATDPTQGLCFPAGAYLPNPPGTPAIAVQGVLF